MKKVLNNKWFYFIVIFIFVLVFNFLTPYIQDDFLLKYIFNTSKKIESIFDVFISLKLYYFTWGGRVFAHFFAYLFLMFPKWIFNLVNSVVYVLNIYLIYLISKGDRKDNYSYSYLLLIHMIVFVFFPVFGQVFLWLDGSCNYSFTLLMQLFFIYKILNIKDGKYNYILYFIISLFAGMCNENSSLSLIVFLILYSFINRDNIKLKITSLIGLIIGYLFMFLAPGNYVRMKTVSNNIPIINNVLSKISLLLLCFGMLFLIFLLILYFFRKTINKKILYICILFYISSFICCFSLVMVPQITLRSLTLVYIFFIIILITLIFEIKYKTLINCVLLFISMLFVFVFITTFKEYYNFYTIMNNRHKLIIKEKRQGKKSIKVKIYAQSKNARIPISCNINDIDENYMTFPNNYVAKYYGVERIIGYE